MKKVAIVDYGLCNLDSVRRAFEECGGSPFVTDEPADLGGADYIVLPGVGSFADAMTRLRDRGLDDALTEEVVGAGAPFLGICLGMQMLATVGTEGGESNGLDWIPGTIRRLEPTGDDRRVPHVGWNEVHAVSGSQLFAGIPSDGDFYFVHSYHFDCEESLSVAATTPYCGGFVAAVEQGNIFGVQFHPEKSQRHGFRLIQNFLAA